MSEWLRQVQAVVARDLTVEWRRRDVLQSMVLFGVLQVIVFSFAFYTDAERARLFAPGIVWVSVLFAASLGVMRLVDREREEGCLEALVMSRLHPSALYGAKLLTTVGFVFAVELVVVPLVFVLFSLKSVWFAPLVAGIALGTVGFCAVAIVFGAALAESRMRELLMPLVVYPLAMPVVIAGVKATAGALQPIAPSETWSWVRFLAGFDILFVFLCGWLFERVMYPPR